MQLKPGDVASQDLTGQVIWITGASSGIGEALAREMAGRGGHIILSARRVDQLRRVQAQLPNPANHLVVPMDAVHAASVSAAVEQVMNTKGKIDWLINNAGVSQRALIADTSAETDRAIMEVDYFAPVALTRLVLPHLLRQGRGQVVFISSVAGLVGTQYRASYAAAKSAIHLWANSLRVEVAAQGVQVAVIFPGFVHTNVSVAALTGDGTALGTMDKAQARGMRSSIFAKKAVKALLAGQEYIVIGGIKEKMGVALSRLSPALMYKLIRHTSVR